MAAWGITRVSDVNDSGLVAVISKADAWIDGHENPGFEYVVDHARIHDLENPYSLQAHLASTVRWLNHEEWNLLIGDAAQKLRDLEEQSPTVTHRLGTDGKSYSEGDFNHLIEEQFDDYEDEFDEPLFSRYQHELLWGPSPLSQGIHKEYLADAQKQGWTVFRSPARQYAIYDGIEEYLGLVDHHGFDIDPDAARRGLDHINAHRFLYADNDEYFELKVQSYFHDLLQDFCAGKMGVDELSDRIHAAYSYSFAPVEAVSRSAEKVFWTKFSDLTPAFEELWFLQASGGYDTDLADHLRSNVEYRLREGVVRR